MLETPETLVKFIPGAKTGKNESNYKLLPKDKHK